MVLLWDGGHRLLFGCRLLENINFFIDDIMHLYVKNYKLKKNL